MSNFNYSEWKETRKKGRNRYGLLGIIWAFFVSVFVEVFNYLVYDEVLSSGYFLKCFIKTVIFVLFGFLFFRYYVWNSNEKKYLNSKQ